MKFKVPENSDSSSSVSSEDSYYSSHSQDHSSKSCTSVKNTYIEMESNITPGPAGHPESSTNFTIGDVEKLSNLMLALNQAPPEAQKYFKDLMEGRAPSIPIASKENDETSTNKVIKRDANFEKWSGEPLTWTPHYYLLKVQCRVYKPLLVTEEAVCMKIYESLPEPQRQRIRGYWVQCGEKYNYNWEEMLSVCHQEYFDKVGAQKAERKLLAMRQGESQIFRMFLQEWELQFEYAGGREWPDSIKINNLRTSLSEKIRDKYAVLDLPTDNYRKWVERITRVAAVMEDSENFVRKGEARTTQYASRSGALFNEYLTRPVGSQPADSPSSKTADSEGDITMSGMKIDLQSLATLVAEINVQGKRNGKGSAKSKPPAPWLTENEVAEIRKKGLCLRCKRSGHLAKFCNIFGPPKKPAHLNNFQNQISLEDDLKLGLGKE